MNALVWRLRQWSRHLGATGLAGLALLAAALILQLAAVAPARDAVATQTGRLAALRHAAAEPAPQPVDPLAGLPPAGAAAQLIGELERLARAHDLELPRGQYSVAPLAGTSLQRWQLVLPLEGPYPALHAFLAAALERLPNLALDELKLERERIESVDLHAELRLSLFVEATP